MTLRPTAKELVELVVLEDVRFFKVEGNVSGEMQEVSASADQQERGRSEEDFELEMTVGERADDRGIVAFGDFSWRRGRASASVTVGALYEQMEGVTEEIEYSEDSLREFADRVALYQMVPFAREGLLTTASRLRIEPPPLLPLMPKTKGPDSLTDVVQEETDEK